MVEQQGGQNQFGNMGMTPEINHQQRRNQGTSWKKGTANQQDGLNSPSCRRETPLDAGGNTGWIQIQLPVSSQGHRHQASHIFHHRPRFWWGSTIDLEVISRCVNWSKISSLLNGQRIFFFTWNLGWQLETTASSTRPYSAPLGAPRRPFLRWVGELIPKSGRSVFIKWQSSMVSTMGKKNADVTWCDRFGSLMWYHTGPADCSHPFRKTLGYLRRSRKQVGISPRGWPMGIRWNWEGPGTDVGPGFCCNPPVAGTTLLGTLQTGFLST